MVLRPPPGQRISSGRFPVTVGRAVLRTVQGPDFSSLIANFNHRLFKWQIGFASRLCIRAFEWFGGATREGLVDNARSAPWPQKL